eukprot:348670-Hanusia_phi.AAC.2
MEDGRGETAKLNRRPESNQCLLETGPGPWFRGIVNCAVVRTDSTSEPSLEADSEPAAGGVGAC